MNDDGKARSRSRGIEESSERSGEGGQGLTEEDQERKKRASAEAGRASAQARREAQQGVDPSKVAGNAQLDPAEQTTREDMPSDAQKSTGEPARGTSPSRRADRSRQRHTHGGEDLTLGGPGNNELGLKD